MNVTAESLHELYSSMNTEALADLYHGGLTDLAVSVLKDVITSRGLDWTEFITPLPTEPESLSDWELWKIESKNAADEIRREPIPAEDENNVGGLLISLGIAAVGLFILGSGGQKVRDRMDRQVQWWSVTSRC